MSRGWRRPEGPEDLAALLSRRKGEEPLPVLTGAPDPPPGAELPTGEEVVSLAGPGFRGVRELDGRELRTTVGAGTRVARLQETLAADGLWWPAGEGRERRSVGGAVAAGGPGPFDASHGNLRRQLLACRVLGPDGRTFRWGRGVVKDVAGYDMRSLWCGSRGRLGALVEVTLRVWPRPAACRRVTLDGPDGARELLDRLADVPPERWFRPDALRWTASAAEPAGRLVAWLVGSEASVGARQRALERWAREEGVVARPVPEVGDVHDSGSRTAAVGAGRAGASASDPSGAARRHGVELRLTMPPRRLAAAAAAAEGALGERLERLEADPAAGLLRCAYAEGMPAASGDEDAAGRLRSLLAAVEVAAGPSRVAVERGGPAIHAVSEERRPLLSRELEGRTVAALGGGDRRWLADYV